MQRISNGLDGVESELVMSRKLLTNFVKRMYTDKVIIAFTFLVVMGIVGIIVYASLNPGQKVRTRVEGVLPWFGVTLPSRKFHATCSRMPAPLSPPSADFQRARCSHSSERHDANSNSYGNRYPGPLNASSDG